MVCHPQSPRSLAKCWPGAVSTTTRASQLTNLAKPVWISTLALRRTRVARIDATKCGTSQKHSLRTTYANIQFPNNMLARRSFCEPNKVVVVVGMVMKVASSSCDTTSAKDKRRRGRTARTTKTHYDCKTRSAQNAPRALALVDDGLLEHAAHGPLPSTIFSSSVTRPGKTSSFQSATVDEIFEFAVKSVTRSCGDGARYN